MHAPPALDDYLEELALRRMSSKAAIYREALMDYVRKVDPERAAQIEMSWREHRKQTRISQSHAGKRRRVAA